jgi:hypothetical protein
MCRWYSSLRTPITPQCDVMDNNPLPTMTNTLIYIATVRGAREGPESPAFTGVSGDRSCRKV